MKTVDNCPCEKVEICTECGKALCYKNSIENCANLGRYNMEKGSVCVSCQEKADMIKPDEERMIEIQTQVYAFSRKISKAC